MDKLTPQTLNVLKNFSSINKNLLVKKGNELSSISEAKNIFAIATVNETFEQDFGIYDLNEFLGAYGLFENPALDFEDTSVVISSGKSKVRYRFADESILTFPTKKINMPTTDVSVTISADTLSQVRKASSTFGNKVASIRTEDDNVVLSVIDPKNSSANTYTIALGEKEGNTKFDLQFLIENLKVIPGDYSVSISSKLISRWENQSEQVQYYIALEKTSSYEG